MSSIIVVSGKSSGYLIPLGAGAVTVGREEGCDLQVLDEMVSRQHMQVRYDEGTDRYHAVDLHSSNGVFVNGTRITDGTPLDDGDEIIIGESKLIFTLQDFPDRDSAQNFIKHRERGRSTMQYKP